MAKNELALPYGQYSTASWEQLTYGSSPDNESPERELLGPLMLVKCYFRHSSPLFVLRRVDAKRVKAYKYSEFVDVNIF